MTFWSKFIIIAALYIGSVGGAFFVAWSWRGAIENGNFLQSALASAEASRAQGRKLNDASAKLEMELSAIRTSNDKLKRKIENEIASQPVYADCIVPDSGVQLYNDAIRARYRARQYDGAGR